MLLIKKTVSTKPVGLRRKEDNRKNKRCVRTLKKGRAKVGDEVLGKSQTKPGKANVISRRAGQRNRAP